MSWIEDQQFQSQVGSSSIQPVHFIPLRDKVTGFIAVMTVLDESNAQANCISGDQLQSNS